jgi:hypothetical protein
MPFKRQITLQKNINQLIVNSFIFAGLLDWHSLESRKVRPFKNDFDRSSLDL